LKNKKESYLISGSFKNSARELILVGLFAAAFGYVEASVVHYLRLHFYPAGFDISLAPLDIYTLKVELGREFATMVMLVSVAWLTRGPFLLKFANFVYAFALWDIVYYAGLYAFEKWPESLLTRDVLFLIPYPWYAPVLAPIALSVLGIAGAILAHIAYEKNGKIHLNKISGWVLFIGLALSLVTFLKPFLSGSLESYEWLLFSASIILILYSYFSFARENLFS
jgi:hypothetical protein